MPRREDLTGQIFSNNLLIVEELGYGKVMCKCLNCGSIHEYYKKSVKSGQTKSCGCMTGHIRIHADTLREIERQRIIKERAELNQMTAEVFGTTKTVSEQAVEEIKKTVEIKNNIPNKIDTYKMILNDMYKFIISENNNDVEVNKEVKLKSLGIIRLSFWIPRINLGIIVHNTFNSNTTKNYEQQISVSAIDTGVRIIQLHDFEWINKNKAIKCYMSNIIGNTGKLKTIGARETSVEYIKSSEAVEFLDKYHLQGGVRSDINIGLKYNDELVGVMVFGVSRYDYNYTHELFRLCYHEDYKVTGGSAKMLRFFLDTHKDEDISIVSFCDIAKFDGNVYKSLGFETIEMTVPGYVWVNSKYNVIPRYKTQKKKLVEKGYGTEAETEVSIMQRLGYRKVSNSGNLKFGYTRESK